MGIEERIVRLFREAIEAENTNDFERAKKKFDKILELSVQEKPDIYFEACFRLADVFIQEDNYRGAVKCALRGICRAPNEELRRAGIQRMGDILIIIKKRGGLNSLAENMEPALNLTKREDRELYEFTAALVKLARGGEVRLELPTKELTEILKDLQG